MQKYMLKKEQIEILFLMLDNYLKQKGLSGIYDILDILKQLNEKIDYDNISEIELNEFHIRNLNNIFDVNLKTMGITIFKDLSSILAILVNEEKNPENIE